MPFTNAWTNKIILNGAINVCFFNFAEVAASIDIKRQQLPDYEDLNGAAAALLRLQDTYQLDASDIARGELGGVQSTGLTGNFTTNS